MKKNKKVIAGLLVAILFVSNTFLSEFSPFLMTAKAAWDGTVAEGFSQGDGTQESPYIIENESEFAYFGSLLSQGMDFSGMYLELHSDIDLSGQSWSFSSTPFNGVLCGNGHTITIDRRLLGSVGTSGKLVLLNIKNINTSLCCAVCGTNRGIIESCGIWSQVDSDEVYKLGLVCEYNYGQFINSYVCGRAAGYNSYIAAIAASNTGVIDNVYTAVSKGITQGGKYAGAEYNPIVLSNSGTITNVYYAYGSSAYGTLMSITTMKSQSFVDTLNKMNPSISAKWVADANNTNDGFPIIVKDEKFSVECYLECSTESVFIYHTEELNTQIITSENVECDVYYTLDGSDPTTSETTQLYDRQGITITDDVVLSIVACKNGIYGKVTTQDIVCILGEGTAEKPYQIDSKKDLCSVYLKPDAHYVLMKDLSFTSQDYSASGICSEGWLSIENFSGVFDGAGHKISNMQGIAGGFVHKNSGTICNVRFANHQLTYKGIEETFGCVANINDGTITRCYVDVQNAYGYGMQYAGGIAGSNRGRITYCYTEGHLDVGGRTEPYGWMYVGGIVGTGTAPSNCYNKANISVRANEDIDEITVGGILGSGTTSVSRDCRNDGNITVNIRYCDYIYLETFSGDTISYTCYGSCAYSVESFARVQKDVENKFDCYNPTTLNNVEKYKEETYTEFDFEETWMITADGPVPQGIMNADGNCYTKTNYVAPTCNEEGSLQYQNQSGETFAETIPATGHLAGTKVCQGLKVCSICEAVIPNEEYPDVQEHAFQETWLSDETNHWKQCQSEECGVVGLVEAHHGGTATPLEQAVCEVCGTPYGELDKSKETYVISASAYNIDSLESLNIALQGTRTYIYGDMVTLTAPKKVGMKFIGWYNVSEDEGTYSGEPICRELQYSFVAEEVRSLAAMYRMVGSGKLRVNGAGFKVNNSVTQTIYNYTKVFTIGERVTLTAVGDNFMYWINESNKIVTKGKEYTFTMAGDVSLTPVFANAEEGTAYVEFISDYDQIIQAQIYSSDSEIEMPGAVNKVGYQFVSWSMTEKEVQDAIAGGETYIRVTPVYEVLTGYFNVLTVYDGDVKNAEVEETFEGYQFKEVVAKNIEGRVFSHWSDVETGESILSTSETYFVYINKNTTIYAIYVDEGVQVEKVSTMVTNEMSAQLIDEFTKSVVVLVTRDVIGGYKLVEHGIIYSGNSIYGQEDAENQMIVGATGVAKGVSTSTAENGTYAHTIVLKEDQLDIVVYARGYMMLEDSEGNQIEVYGSVVSGSYNQLSQ